MSLTVPQITSSALAVVGLANQLKAAYVIAKEYSDYNSVTDPGWGSLASSVPAAVSNGLVVGTQFAPGDVSNAIGSINEYINYWTGVAVPTSAWGQNLEKLSAPTV